jgi:hypothetical protein
MGSWFSCRRHGYEHETDELPDSVYEPETDEVPDSVYEPETDEVPDSVWAAFMYEPDNLKEPDSPIVHPADDVRQDDSTLGPSPSRPRHWTLYSPKTGKMKKPTYSGDFMPHDE